MSDPIEDKQHRKEFMASRARRFHGLVIAGVFFVAGIASFLFGSDQIADAEQIGLVCVAIALGVAIYVVRTNSDPEVGMVLDDDGLWFRDWGLPAVPWRYIADAYPIGARLRPMICVEIVNSDVFFSGLDQTTQQRARGNPLVRPPQLKVRNGSLDAALNEIVAAIRANCNRS